MSIQSEIDRINEAKSELGDALRSRGAVLTEGATLSEFAEAVYSMPNAVSESDYTAFEVYASDVDITTTTKASDIDERFIPIIFRKPKSELTAEELNSTPVKNNIIANKTHAMRVNSSADYNMNDILIDWGDGTYLDLSTAYDTNRQAIANAEVVSAAKNSDGMVLYKVKHTYASSGIYKVSIYGRKYWRIDHEGCDPDNLLCRALTPDLPIASNFTNLSSYCNTCRRLFDIDLAYYTPGLRQRIDNFSGTFTNCFNLRRVEWFGCTNYVIQGVPKIFYNCQNVTTIKYKLPTNFGDEDQGIKSAFGWCKNLAMDIGDLFPSGNFTPRKITVGELFRRCAKLYGTVPADKLWNDTRIEWVDTANAFEGCSAEILAQVPVSWGGAAPDDIIRERVVFDKVMDTSSSEVSLNVKAGTTYTYKKPLTKLTISSSDVSSFEATIYFTSADSITVALPDSIDIIGAMEFSPNKSYVMSIKDGIAISAEVFR